MVGTGGNLGQHIYTLYMVAHIKSSARLHLPIMVWKAGLRTWLSMMSTCRAVRQAVSSSAKLRQAVSFSVNQRQVVPSNANQCQVVSTRVKQCSINVKQCQAMSSWCPTSTLCMVAQGIHGLYIECIRNKRPSIHQITCLGVHAVSKGDGVFEVEAYLEPDQGILGQYL